MAAKKRLKYGLNNTIMFITDILNKIYTKSDEIDVVLNDPICVSAFRPPTRRIFLFQPLIDFFKIFNGKCSCLFEYKMLNLFILLPVCPSESKSCCLRRRCPFVYLLFLLIKMTSSAVSFRCVVMSSLQGHQLIRYRTSFLFFMLCLLHVGTRALKLSRKPPTD